jgi:prepilin-type processing-associated H-X9-DG protein
MSDDSGATRDSPHRPRITLVELLVVFALGVLLLGLVLPWFQTVRDRDWNRMKCMNNLKQLAIATINAGETNKKLPPFFGIYADNPKFKGKPYPATMWYHLLPYVEEAGVYSRLPPIFDVESNTITIFPGWSAGHSSAANENAGCFRIPTFLCAADGSVPPDGVATTIALSSRIFEQDFAGGDLPAVNQAVPWAVSSYAANYLVFGMIPNARIPDSITDGTSKTILFTEKFASCADQSTGLYGGNLWAFPPFFPPSSGLKGNYAGTVGFFPSPANPTDPYQLALFQDRPAAGACNPTLAQTPHKDGINVAMADGSVRFVSTKISPQTWSAALTPWPIEGISYPVGEQPRPDQLGSDWND